MARSPAQNAALRAASHDRLVLGAMTCFAERGFVGVTVRDIAARAGLSIGVLYQHYPNKEALLAAAFERSMVDVRATFAAAFLAQPGDQLATLIRAATSTVREHLPFWRLGYAARHQPDVVRTLGPALGEWTAEINAVLTTLLREGGSPAPELDAIVLFAQIDGMCEHFALAPDTYPLEAVAEQVILSLAQRWGAC